MLTQNGCDESMEKFTSPAGCSHAGLYKNAGIDSDVLHFKHRAEAVQLRKKKRDDGFDRARRMTSDYCEEDCARAVYDPDLIADLLCDDENRVLGALHAYSRILTKGSAVEEALEMGLFNTFIDVFMKSASGTLVESEVVMVLSEMSTDIRPVAGRLTSGPIAKLVNCFKSDNSRTCINALFILEGIVSFDPFRRCDCDEVAVLPKALDLYFRFDDIALKRQLMAFLNGYFTFITPVDELNNKMMLLLEFVLSNESDEVLLNETLDTLNGICLFGHDHISMVLAAGFLDHCFALLPNLALTSNVLKFTNTLAAEKEILVQLYEKGFFDAVMLISNDDKTPQKIVAASFYMLTQFVKNGVLEDRQDCAEKIIDRFLCLLRDSAFDIRKHAMNGLHEVLSTKNGNLIDICVNKGLFRAVCDLLTVMNVDVVLQALSCLQKAMEYGVLSGQADDYVAELESVNAPEKLDFLMNSQCYEIFKAADAFLTNVISTDPINGIVRDVAYIAKNAWEQIVGRIKFPRVVANENGFSFQLDDTATEPEGKCPRCLPARPELIVGTWNLVLWSHNFQTTTMTDVNNVIDKLEQGKPIYTEASLDELLTLAPDIYCPRLTVLNATDVTRFEYIYQIPDGRQKSIIGVWENLRDGTFFWRVAPTINTRLCVAFATVNQVPQPTDFVILNQVDSWPSCANYIALSRSRDPANVNNIRDFMEQQNLDGAFNKIKKLYCPGMDVAISRPDVTVSGGNTVNGSVIRPFGDVEKEDTIQNASRNSTDSPDDYDEDLLKNNVSKSIDPFALPRNFT
ncbi:unnamed protein product [Bursaphelenchus okinawaensis]|uniref:Uncharacterized protein n=1 Tax=Bursaphelenchus okinawaensis TaxID=465554 RepID=A0A811L5E0_9BILA|nr:unnamed protein product [Bursaphelenchus okinawaensis]CAG9119846.1 unnamed protein product [Bursaphelenchus okinawaensis]